MKNTFVISSPFDTYSGYGARSRDVIKAIIESGKYEVKLTVSDKYFVVYKYGLMVENERVKNGYSFNISDNETYYMLRTKLLTYTKRNVIFIFVVKPRRSQPTCILA